MAVRPSGAAVPPAEHPRPTTRVFATPDSHSRFPHIGLRSAKGTAADSSHPLLGREHWTVIQTTSRGSNPHRALVMHQRRRREPVTPVRPHATTGPQRTPRPGHPRSAVADASATAIPGPPARRAGARRSNSRGGGRTRTPVSVRRLTFLLFHHLSLQHPERKEVSSMRIDVALNQRALVLVDQVPAPLPRSGPSPDAGRPVASVRGPPVRHRAARGGAPSRGAGPGPRARAGAADPHPGSAGGRVRGVDGR